MSNNRELLNERDMVRAAQIVEKGIPLPFLDNKFRVDEGWWGVVTEGGAFKEILEPGTHFMRRYHQWRDIRIQLVKKLQYTLDVKTRDELQIRKPLPVKVKLDVSVECRVTDPRRVATEIDRPLAALWDRTVQAARDVLSFAERDDVLIHHDRIGRGILQQLQAMQLKLVLGIDPFHVNVVTLETLGTGADELAKAEMQRLQRIEDWKLDTVMIGQSQMTPEWLMVHRPEIYQQMLAGNQSLLKELIDKGLLDPAGFMNQPLGASAVDPRQLLGNVNLGGLLGVPGAGGATTSPQSNYGQPAALGSGVVQPVGADGALARIREEVDLLRAVPGAQAKVTTGVDDSGLPDGSYAVDLAAPRPSGGTMRVFFICPKGYPQIRPELELELDDQVRIYQGIK